MWNRINFNIKMSMILTGKLKYIDKLMQTIKDTYPNDAYLYSLFYTYEDIKHTTESQGIEGGTLTEDETYILINYKTVPKNKVDFEELSEYSNLYRAIIEMHYSVEDRRELSEELILNLHNILGFNIIPGSGMYKTSMNSIGDGYFQTATIQQTPKLMGQLLKEYHESELHPVVKAFLFGYSFIGIHPFHDGNGRTARILENYVLEFNGYPNVIIKKENAQKYIEILKSGFKNDTPYHEDYILWYCDLLVSRLEDMIETLEKTYAEDGESNGVDPIELDKIR